MITISNFSNSSSIMSFLFLAKFAEIGVSQNVLCFFFTQLPSARSKSATLRNDSTTIHEAEKKKLLNRYHFLISFHLSSIHQLVQQIEYAENTVISSKKE